MSPFHPLTLSSMKGFTERSNNFHDWVSFLETNSLAGKQIVWNYPHTKPSDDDYNAYVNINDIKNPSVFPFHKPGCPHMAGSFFTNCGDPSKFNPSQILALINFTLIALRLELKKFWPFRLMCTYKTHTAQSNHPPTHHSASDWDILLRYEGIAWAKKQVDDPSLQVSETGKRGLLFDSVICVGGGSRLDSPYFLTWIHGKVRVEKVHAACGGRTTRSPLLFASPFMRGCWGPKVTSGSSSQKWCVCRSSPRFITPP